MPRKSKRAAVDFPIVGIGASAGGLEALKKFFVAMPADANMAFVVIQHLDPTHESLTADLLGRCTSMKVVEVSDRIPVAANRVYVIPPNKYLTLREKALYLSEPVLHRGLRMPIDHFFRSLAEDQQEKAIGLIFSGTGSDGTLGLRAIKGSGGLGIAQDPETAQYDPMPRSAIASGGVDYIQPVEAMPETLTAYLKHVYVKDDSLQSGKSIEEEPDHLRAILSVLRTRTKFDFRCYKKGTLARRIRRRMGLGHIEATTDYVEFLRNNPAEISALSKDLLIGVTSFFREPEAFKLLDQEVLAKLVAAKGADQPIRIWVPGCATGEEPYSIAILLSERLQAMQQTNPIQIFATDIDEEALGVARAGLYPENIAADIAPERLRRYFIQEGNRYQIIKPLREAVVFAIQNLISDPPFSKLDLISCRNLLIYLEPEVQRKIINLFHFSLNEDGYLLLGSAETIGQQDELFEPLSKKWRLYRRTGMASNAVEFPIITSGATKAGKLPITGPPPLEPGRLNELAQRQLLENYAPPSVMVNQKYQMLYFHGPIDRYLKRPAGLATNDLLSSVREGLLTKLRAALYRASQQQQPITVSGAHILEGTQTRRVTITVQPVLRPKETECLLLISFEEAPAPPAAAADGGELAGTDESLVHQLELEIKTTKEELQSTIEEMESANEELKAANEEVMSINEELQSTNEELETSKEELQSLNEEMATVNNQLQDKVAELDRANNDLINLLSSTDIATLFLDEQLRIKRYTPVMTKLINLLPTDIGRPVSDVAHQFRNGNLSQDTQRVLAELTPVEREVHADDGHWYLHRIHPYRTRDNRIDGVVVTFIDITERKRIEVGFREAKEKADQANFYKSEFLTASSHDLRQPLQTLELLNEVLLRTLQDPGTIAVVRRQRESAKAMRRLLDTLLDIGKLEGGKLTSRPAPFPVDELLSYLRTEFTPQCEDKHLVLRVVPCTATIHSDRNLIERILNNFLANAITHTDKGRVLLGCRRRGNNLRIEVWDTGKGMAEARVEKILNLFYRANGPTNERYKQLGLGLTIVQRLANMLGHGLDVTSVPGKGSMFAVIVPLLGKVVTGKLLSHEKDTTTNALAGISALLIENDTAIAEAMKLFLSLAGCQIQMAASSAEALAQLERSGALPDLTIADYRLDGQETGIEVIKRLRQALGRELPAILLTGDTSPTWHIDAEALGCPVLYKPVDSDMLVARIRQLLGTDEGGQQGK